MINFEMPNELIIVPKRSKTKEEIAWENTLAVHDWIWKCLQKRKIPYEDMDDAFSACQIEVYKLMLRYNTSYSKTTWASYGILKGITQYESTSGTIRLPIHIIEKMHRLNRRQFLMSQDGHEMTPEEMADYVGMSINDILTAQEKQGNVEPCEVQDFLNHKNDSIENVFVNGPVEPSVIDRMISDCERTSFYRMLHDLNDIQIFVLLHRFSLDWNDIPWRKNFFNERSDMCIATYQADQRVYGLSEIGQMIGVSRERVRQIEASAIGILRGEEEQEE